VIVRRATLGEILPLRHAELRPGRPVETAHFDGDAEPSTVHLGAFDDDGTIVCCTTLMRRPYDGADAVQLRGMATRAERARTGVGTQVVRFAETLVHDDLGCRVLWCNARTGAVGFYAKLGWTVTSAEFDVPDVGPHVRMVRRL
jgi:predicted GNAT family N-acyltransferase